MNTDLADPCSSAKIRALNLLIQARVNRFYIRNPKHLAINLKTAQAVFWQIFLFQTKESEVRQIAEHGLKPTMLSHDFAHARVLKLVDIECQHRDVLRSARRCNRVKNRL